MKRFCIAVFAASLAFASSARAYIITVVSGTPGTATIQNKANQTITLAITGEASDPLLGGADPQIAGFVLRGQLGDGNGAAVEPHFVSFDFINNTVFAPAHGSDANPANNSADFSGQNGTGVAGTQNSDANAGINFHNTGITTTTVNTTPANLVNIVLDASNITAPGSYTLNLLTSPDAGGSSKVVLNGGTTVSPTSANITVAVTVPEPTGGLSVLAISALLALRRRRTTRRVI